MSNNLFSALQQSDDEDQPQQQQKKKTHTKKVEEPLPALEKEVKKENTKHDHQAPKSKALTSEPHPKDRQSGTGRGKELRKEGGGRSNWGNYKDDLKEDKYEVKENEHKPAAAVEQVEAPVVEEKQAPTIAEYYQSKGLNYEEYLKKQEAPKQATKRPVNADELKKDKLEVVKTKEDARRELEAATKKGPVRQTDTYKKEFKTQAVEYLSFYDAPAPAKKEFKQDRPERQERTDKQDRPYKPRREEKEGEQQAEENPQGNNRRGQRRNNEDKPEATETNQAEQQGEQQEGDKQHGERHQGDRQHGDRQQGDRPYKKQYYNKDGDDNNRGYRGNNRREGGDNRRDGDNRREGDNRRPQGDRPQGDRPQGDRPHNDRPHQDRPQQDRTQNKQGDRDNKPQYHKENKKANTGAGFLFNEKDFPAL